MKITKFFIVLLIVLQFFTACQDDITELSDPRDAICVGYRVTELLDNGEDFYYDCELIKSSEDQQTVYIWNLNGIDGDASVGQIPTSEMFTGKLAAGTNKSVLTLDRKTLKKDDEDITILEGSATINAEDITRFTLTYKIQYATDPAKTITADFGLHQQDPTKKKKAKKALQ